MNDFDYNGRSKEAVGRRLLATRTVIDLTQGELGKITGISQSRYSMFETGERLITVKAAHGMCDAFNITLDWIYRGDISHLRRDIHSHIFSST